MPFHPYKPVYVDEMSGVY